MRRVPELDALRGVAAVTVVTLHAATVCPALRNPLLMRWGWTAVDLFFVISGYLITAIILRSWTSEKFLANFYARRSLRIWPIYYLTLLAFAAGNLVLPRPFPTAGMPYYLLYAQEIPRYWFGVVPPFCKGFAHTWSLAVEEQFYLVWPLIVGLAGRRRLVPICVAVAGLAVATRAWGGWGVQLLMTRCDGLALGGLLAAILDDEAKVTERSVELSRKFAGIIILGVAYLAAVTILTPAREPNDPEASQTFESLNLFVRNLTFFGAVGLCVCGTGQPALAWLRSPRLRGLGAISYGLYLYHNPLLAVAQKLIGRPNLPWPVAIAALLATLAVAALSWRFIERPILGLKARFEYENRAKRAGNRAFPGPGEPDIEPERSGVTDGDSEGDMDDRITIFATAGLMLGLFVHRLIRRKLDPFEPIWLFFVGYAQIYVVQALSYRQWALDVRGPEIVADANLRALWALGWFLLVYGFGPGKWLARRMPKAPESWSFPLVAALSPAMVLWGLICSGMLIMAGGADGRMSGEENLLRQFPIFMLVAGVMLIVTGNRPAKPRPVLTAIGLLTCLAYVVIWMFNGKRSHSLIGLLTGVCAYYTSKGKKPSLPTLACLAFAGALVVSVAIGWRGNYRYEQSASGFLTFLGDFRLDSILVNLNVKEASDVDPSRSAAKTYETEEVGGFLLMMSTVPDRSDYDYGSVYNRVWSTYIPRIYWPEKPYYGQAEWVHAWQAGSEQARSEGFTGPSIGILGACQLNGGAIATAIVMAALAILLSASYQYFLAYKTSPWAQAWWALSYYNAWLMTVNDNPLIWFYYIYGHTTLPPMLAFFLANKYGDVKLAAKAMG